MKTVVLLLTIFLSFFSFQNLYGQETTKDSLYYADLVAEAKKQFFETSDLKKCREICEVVIAENQDDYRIKKTIIPFSKAYMFLGSTYRENETYDTAMLYYQKALEIMEENGYTMHPERADIFTHMGNYYNRKRTPVFALEVADSAINILLSNHYPLDYEYLCDAYSQKLYANIFLGNLEKALEAGNKEIEAASHLEESHIYRQIVNTHLAWVYSEKGDYLNALRNQEISKNLILKNKNARRFLANIYYQLGATNFEIGNYYSAINFFLECYYEAPTPIFKFYTLNSISKCYKNLEDFQSAYNILLKSSQLAEANFPPNHQAHLNIKNDISKVLFGQKKYEEALGINLEVLMTFQNFKGKITTEDFAGYFGTRGEIYAQTNKLDSAEYYYSKAFEIIDTDTIVWKFSFTKYGMMLALISTKKNDLNKAKYYIDRVENYHPEINFGFSSKYGTFDLFNRTVKIIYYSRLQEKEPSEEISTTLKNLLLESIALEKELRKTIWDNTSLSRHTDKYFQFYNGLLELSVSNENLLSFEDQFDISESNKAIKLLSEIKKLTAIDFGGLPPETIEKEESLKSDISQYSAKLKSNFTGENDFEDSEYQRINNLWVEKKLEYDSLMMTIEKENPKYYQLKNEFSVATLDFIQDSILDESQTLIEYFLGDSLIFIFTIDKNSESVTIIKKTLILKKGESVDKWDFWILHSS
ncbi:MAG: tetratricopeptide repeat protein [Saprospiraceae bacterium]